MPSPSGPPASVAALVTEATDAYQDGQTALRAGDFAGFGRAQERLRLALDQLQTQQGSTPAASPAPTPTP